MYNFLCDFSLKFVKNMAALNFRNVASDGTPTSMTSGTLLIGDSNGKIEEQQTDDGQLWVTAGTPTYSIGAKSILLYHSTTGIAIDNPNSGATDTNIITIPAISWT